MKTKYKAVIFDLDGTLLNTLDDLTDSVNEFLAEAGKPQRTSEEIRQFLGDGALELVRRSLPPEYPAEDLPDALRAYKEIYARNMHHWTRPYLGVVPLLADLQHAGIRTAVVSNKPDQATRALCEEQFGRLIDAAVGDRPGVRRKPDPEAVDRIIADFGLSPGDVLYVGDSEVDVETAKRAGLDGAAVTWGFRTAEELEAAGAERLVHQPEEIAILAGVHPGP